MAIIWLAFSWLVIGQVHRWQDQIEQRVNASLQHPLGLQARVEQIRGQSAWWQPMLALHNIRLHDKNQREVLHLASAQLHFSPWSLLRGGLSHIALNDTQLHIRRDAQGRWWLAGVLLQSGQSSDSPALRWLLAQNQWVVRNARIDFLTEANARQAEKHWTFDQIHLDWQNQHTQHRLQLKAHMPWGETAAPTTEAWSFRANWNSAAHAPDDWTHWQGQLNLQSPYTDWAALANWAHSVGWLQPAQAQPWLPAIQALQPSASAAVQLKFAAQQAHQWQLLVHGVKMQPAAVLGAHKPATPVLGMLQLDWEKSAPQQQLLALIGMRTPAPQTTPKEHTVLRLNALHLAAAQEALLKVFAGNPAVLQRLQSGQGSGVLEHLQLGWTGSATEVQKAWQQQVTTSHTEQARHWQNLADALSQWLQNAQVQVQAQAKQMGWWPSQREGFGIRNFSANLALSTAFSKPARPTQAPLQLQLDIDAPDFSVHMPTTLAPHALRFDRLQAQLKAQHQTPASNNSQAGVTPAWVVQGNGWRWSHDMSQGSADWRWQSGAAPSANGGAAPLNQENADQLQLKAQLARLDLAKLMQWLPTAVPADLRDYLQHAFQAGLARSVRIHANGSLSQPTHLLRQTQIQAQLHGVHLRYLPHWPAVQQLSGQLQFDRGNLQLSQLAARIEGTANTRISNAHVQLRSLNHAAQAQLQLKLHASSPLSELLYFVQHSALNALTGQALASFEGDDTPATVQVQLDTPLAPSPALKVQGQIALAKHRLRLNPNTPWLQGVQGRVHFSEHGFRLDETQAQLLSETIDVSGGSLNPQGQPQSLLLQARGRLSAKGLRDLDETEPDFAKQFQTRAIASRLQGVTDYVFELNAPTQSSTTSPATLPTMQLRSNLQGLAIDLPSPFGKTDKDVRNLRLQSHQAQQSALHKDPKDSGQSTQVLALHWQDAAHVVYEVEHLKTISTATAPTRMHVRRGQLQIGQSANRFSTSDSASLPDQGVTMALDVPELNLDLWQSLLSPFLDPAAPETKQASTPQASHTPASATPLTFMPSTFTVQTAQLIADGRRLHDVVLGGSTLNFGSSSGVDPPKWLVNLSAKEFAGYLEYTQAQPAKAPGHLRMRLSHLHIAAANAADADSLLDEVPTQKNADDTHSSAPTLDIEINSLHIFGRDLGQLFMQARNVGDAWELQRLALSNAEAKLNASATWAAKRNGETQRRIAMQFRLDTSDAGALSRRLGLSEVLDKGNGFLVGNLNWRGAPWAPDMSSLNGNLSLDLGEGRLLKVNPGAAKLIGALSLQSLGRRLKLNFDDVVDNGLSFDYIKGDAQIDNGLLRTNNLEMKTTNIAVSGQGEVNLLRRSQDLRITVVPKLDVGTASLLTAIVNPLVGAGTFLTQLVFRSPLADALTQHFQVSGTWRDPLLQEISKQTKAQASEAANPP